MGVFPVSIFFGVDIMIKIKAKRLLMGTVLKLFFSFVLAGTVSLIGLLTVFVAAFGTGNDTVKDFFSETFSQYASVIRIAACVLTVLFGLFIFSLGRNIGAAILCRAVSDKRPVCSAKRAFEFLLLYAVKSLFTLCWGFVFLLPSAVCSSFLIMSLSQGAMEKNVFFSWLTGCIVLFVIGLCFTFVTLQRYSLWKYYLCRDGGVISSLFKSLEKTRDRSVKIALFKLSMLGWILSCVFIVPVVYVLPYYRVSTALFSLEERENEQEKKREEIPPAVFEIIKDL